MSPQIGTRKINYRDYKVQKICENKNFKALISHAVQSGRNLLKFRRDVLPDYTKKTRATGSNHATQCTVLKDFERVENYENCIIIIHDKRNFIFVLPVGPYLCLLEHSCVGTSVHAA